MYRLCHLNDIANKSSKGFETPLGPVFAVKKKQVLYLYANACPHLGITLEWADDEFLDSSRQLIQCASHGAQFLIKTGQCISGPCQGQSLRPIPYEVNAEGDVLLATPQTQPA